MQYSAGMVQDRDGQRRAKNQDGSYVGANNADGSLEMKNFQDNMKF
jgi:hypothetical protein